MLILVLLAGTAMAQVPDRPVRLLIPYPAGGSIDAVARPVAQRFQEITGQPLVLDNRGGANGLIAADAVAKARPDGYTLIMTTAGPITIAPALVQAMPYDPRTDLLPVTGLVSVPFTLFASAHFVPRTLAEVIAAGRASPGQIALGLPGNGSIGHLAAELFAQSSGTRWMPVAYRGASQVLNDMIAGTIALSFTTIASARPFVEAGSLRPIAVAALERTSAMPELPTFAELGLPQVQAPLWVGVMAPARTPPAVVARLNAIFLEALKAPSVRTAMQVIGADILNQGPAEFAAFLDADYPRWAEVVRRGNTTLN